MQIKEITIENLKTFVEKQNLRLAPFTLLYGENSSGKSTLLKVFDILNQIFNHGIKDFITDDSRYGISDMRKNLNANRIHHYSSFNNHKNIKISFKLKIPTPGGFWSNKYYNTENFFFEKITESKKNNKLFFNDLGLKYKTKKIKTTLSTFEVTLELKYYKDLKRPHLSGSKVNSIEVKNNSGILITLKRANKHYSYLKDKSQPGYIDEKKRKKNLERYFEDRDFFTTPYGYGDYKFVVPKESLLIKSLYENFINLFNSKKENSKKYKKIKLILSIYKKYLVFELKNRKKYPYDNLKTKRQIIFDYIAKFILNDELKNPLYGISKGIDKDYENIFNLSEETIKELNLVLAHKLIEKKRKNLVLFSLLLSFMDYESIYSVDLLLSKFSKNKMKLFNKTLCESFENIYMRYIRNLFVGSYPYYINKNNDAINSSYNDEFLKKHNLKFQQNEKLYNSLYEFLYSIIKYINDEPLTGSITHDSKEKIPEMLIMRTPYMLFDIIISQINSFLRNIRACSPSNSEAEFSTYTNQDLKKFEELSINDADDKFNLIDSARKREQVIGLKYRLRKEELTLLERAKEFMEKEEKTSLGSNELYYKNPDHIGMRGENFDEVLINNIKIRKSLNKILKKYFQIEIKVINLKYLKNFTKKEKISIKNFIKSKGLEFFHFKEKFIMIKDLRFKKSFDIHGLEIGKGPKNILPFLAQLLNERPNLIFPIQELENNWHPKYHSKLIILLIEILNLSKNKSIIMETHSELFVLQVQKLIQKGIIKPDFVSINYISRSKNGISKINNMPLNSQGGFTEPWPGGFFNERLEILNS
tara:strand:+ start:387 stop:2834 length:2448 start_codon:yes stop_codon:yes gene_type:complete